MGIFFSSEWIGLDNFRYLFSLNEFQTAFKNTLILAFAKNVVNILVPLILALMLNEVGHALFKKAVQTIIYIPYFLSWVILGGILVDMLSPAGGFVNQIVTALGGEPIYFLGDPRYIRSVMVISNEWKEMGYNTVIFLAALTGIDPALYEAAQLDGAGHTQRLWYITLPSILPMIILVTVLGIGNVLNAGFDQVFNLYSPIVYGKVDIIDTLVYRIGMRQLQYSLSTAIGLFKSAVSFILITLSFYLAKRFAGYRLF